MVISKNCNLVKVFKNEIKESDFKFVEEELPPLKDGEFRTEALYWSADPYQRGYVTEKTGPSLLNKPMIGAQIGRVIESKNPDFKVGDNVCGFLGWRTHTNINMKDQEKAAMPTYKLPDLEGLPLSYGLGVIGITGLTAYFGLLEVCHPKVGETVVVSGAAGAVGSVAGLIAKIKGCKVIGIAGSDEKTKWLTNELKFDHAINYKTENIGETLKKVAPQGVDCYFDNVGGDVSDGVLSNMNMRGRISVSGAISAYNSLANEYPKAPLVQSHMIRRHLLMIGFGVDAWRERFSEALEELRDWTKQGKLIAGETITVGFENAPKALIGMMRGENTGKAVIKP